MPATAISTSRPDAARVTGLGLPSMRASLEDRLVTHACAFAEVVSELGAAPATLRRLLDRSPCQRPGSGLRWWPSRSPHPGVFQWWVPWSSPPVGAGEAAVGAAVMLARCVLGNAGAAAAPGGGAV